jgi:hypothetical protein
MAYIGLAELTLGLIGALFILTIMGGLVAAFLVPAHPEALLHARRMSVLRGTAAIVTALTVFGVAVLVHMMNPPFEAVPFVMGPLASTAAGLAVFAVMPAPTIDGAVRRRGASLVPRRIQDYTSAGQRRLFVSLLSAAIAVILACGLASKARDDGRWMCTALFPSDCTDGGPFIFPGWLFAAPVLLLIVALLGTMTLALRRIITAPGAAWSELINTDSELRTAAVRMVLRIGSAPIVLTLAIFLGAAGLPLFNAEVLDTGLTSNGSAVAHLAGTILLGASVLVFVYGFALAVLTVVDAVRLPRLVSDNAVVSAT